MPSIPLIRSAQVNLFVAAARRRGLPVEADLAQARLPATMEDQPDGYVPLQAVDTFLERLLRRRLGDELTYEAFSGLSTAEPSRPVRDIGCGSRTLGDRLSALFAAASLECNRQRSWSTQTAHTMRIHSRLDAALAPASRAALEWLQAATVIATVSDALGRRWTPSALGFTVRVYPAPSMAAEYPGVRLAAGCASAWVEVPAALLAQPLAPAARYGRRPAPTLASPRMPEGFAASLGLMLRSYLGETYPDIALAAELAGLSVRSLQRRLALAGLTYSGLVQQTRFEMARELLSDPQIKVIEVAYAVGYEDPSHFTRAFRRRTGLSPLAFRRSQAEARLSA